MDLSRFAPQQIVTRDAQASANLTSLLLLLVLACASLFACQSARPPPPPPTTNASRTTNPTPPEDHLDALATGSSFRNYSSSRFHFSLGLPDGASFHVDDTTERWFLATHTPTTSTLLVRAWREYEIMDRTSCEERARLQRTLPERDRRMPIEERRIDVPPEHDTIVDVRIREQTRAPRYEGTVLAFGGWAHRCFAFVFVTQDDEKKTVVARLSTVVHGTLERMKFDNDLGPKRQPPDLKTPLRLDLREGPTR